MITTTPVPKSQAVVFTRPEHELLLCCARSKIDALTAERIKILVAERIDWEYLLQMASHHEIMPLVYTSLDTTCSELVPIAILSQLRHFCHTNATTSIFLAKELTKLLELFTANQISLIPFKGPSLGSFVYGNIGLRMAGDLDLLVRQQDIFRAKDLLLSHQYEQITPKKKLSPTQETIYIERKHEFAFLHKTNALPVELQWTTLDKRFSVPFQFDQLWDNLTTTTLLGINVPTLSPEDLILLLCLESYKEHWARLKRIVDIAECINNHRQLNWELIIAKANQFRIYKIVSINLALAQELLGVTLPESISQKLFSEVETKSLVFTISKWFFEKPEGVFECMQKACFPLIHIQAREKFEDKFQYCLFSGLTNEKDWEMLTLPLFLSFLYYLIRPIRLFRILIGYIKR